MASFKKAAALALVALVAASGGVLAPGGEADGRVCGAGGLRRCQLSIAQVGDQAQRVSDGKQLGDVGRDERDVPQALWTMNA